MATTNKSGFRTVGETETNEYKRKLREHRLHVLKRTAVIIFVLVLIVIGIALFMAFRQYTGFDITSSVERSDTAANKV